LQGELGWSYRRLTEATLAVEGAQLFLKTLVEDLVAILAQEHE